MKKGILVLGVIITLAGMFFQGKGMERAVETVGELSNREHPKVALTFDDGPHMVYTEMLLDGLKERGICATFFLIGKNIEGNEEIVQRMQKEGASHWQSYLSSCEFKGAFPERSRTGNSKDGE